jgi:hypothetical protein
MNLSKFIHAYKRDGAIGFFNIFLAKIGFKYRFKTLIQKRIVYLEKYLKNITDNIVQSGPYINLKLRSEKSWSDYDFCSKILGVYEIEVQTKLLSWSSKNFVNLGGAEGYHGLGQIISNTKTNLIVFEQDEKSKKILTENAKLNNLLDKVKVLGKADNDFLEKLNYLNIDLKETCFLIDIEGDEYRILNLENIKKLNKSKLLIELHLDDNYQLKLLDNLKKFFNLEILTTTSRDFSKFDFLKDLNDVDRWILANENRPNLMKWVSCTPK